MQFLLRAVAILLAIFPLIARADDAPAAIARFDSFGKIDTAPLVKGEILTQTNTSMNFARGISSQAIYFVAQPAAKVAQTLPTWNPAPHKDLDVFQYRAFQGEADANFDSIKINPHNDAMKRLLAAMADPSSLQLSAAEVANIRAAANPRDARRFWADALRTRLHDFATGGLATLPPSVTGGENFSIPAELKSLLAEEPRIAARFDELLKNLKSPHQPTAYYWSNSKVDKLAAVDLGAIFVRNAGDHWQILDADFYVSSGYLTALTCAEIWPWHGGSLVWEGDLVSAPGLAGGFGLKRKIASFMIQSDMKASISAFRQDVSR